MGPQGPMGPRGCPGAPGPAGPTGATVSYTHLDVYKRQMEHSPSSRLTSTFPPISPAWISDVKFSLIFPTGVPVSYTHLDVYKRQGSAQSGLKALSLLYEICVCFHFTPLVTANPHNILSFLSLIQIFYLKFLFQFPSLILLGNIRPLVIKLFTARKPNLDLNQARCV